MNFEELHKDIDPLLKVLSGKWFTAPFYESENWLLDDIRFCCSGVR